jgi:hypothetical protein
MSSFQFPPEVYNHIITFRPAHPVAKLMREFTGKFSYCVVCYEKERVPNCQCCSSDCQRQLVDANYYEEPHEGDIFRRFVEEKV